MSNLRKEMFADVMEEEWLDKLWPVLSSEEMAASFSTIAKRKKFKVVYPKFENAFRAFKETPYKDVRVVIVGQDPYHDGSADGLAFSCRYGKRCPPSLKTILFEVERDALNGLHLDRVTNWDLTGWAQQGVLLINTALTVEKSNAGSHAKLWSFFTEEVFKLLRVEKTGIIYLLWGNHAKNFEQHINKSFNYVLTAGHPSPLNTTNPFKGCSHFTKTNEYLVGQNGPGAAIDWAI